MDVNNAVDSRKLIIGGILYNSSFRMRKRFMAMIMIIQVLYTRIHTLK